MAKLASAAYGEALYELALENNAADEFLAQTEELRRILDEYPEFSRLLTHPKIGKEEKVQTVEEVFRGNIDDALTGFLKLLVEKDRVGDLSAILTCFSDKIKAWKGIGVSYVTSAKELSDAQKSALENRLLSTTPYKEMEMHYATDGKLLGGMVVRIGDHVVDNSIKSRLDTMERELLKIQL